MKTIIDRILPNLRFKQFKTLCMLLFSYSVALFYKKKRNVWIVSEKYSEARDNGYWMFLYIKKHHPEIDCRYLIYKGTVDRDKLKTYEDSLIVPNTLKHYILLWKSSYLLGGQINGGYPSMVCKTRFLQRLVRDLNPSCKIVFLKHGVIKDYMTAYIYPHFKPDLFVCGAKPEYDYIADNYKYPKGVVKYLGLARFDHLHNFTVDEKQILVMPTWRHWLDKSNFLDSLYYHSYKDLLLNPDLHQLLAKHNAKLVFYPHFRIQNLGLLSHFSSLNLPDSIVIADKSDYDVQTLLKESAMLITDFSSVFFDFAYMRKPIIYYQFDEEEYRKNHYSQGYYDYHNGLGPWFNCLDELVAHLKEKLDTGIQNANIYKQRIQSFFLIYDSNNCERIFNEITKL